jgi:hypothetical protein
VPLFLPPDSPEFNPMERRWRDLKDKLANVVSQTVEALSDAVCAIVQSYSDAILQLLTGFTQSQKFAHAVRSLLNMSR